MNNCGIRPFRGKPAAPHSVNRRPVRILALVLALFVGLSACGTAAGGFAFFAFGGFAVAGGELRIGG